MFNSYIKSKLEYCSTVWSPVEQKGINEIENIQRTFTKKIEGMEELDYHQRLKELKMYSLERRRERYMIIYAWQQLEGIKENVLKLKTSRRSGTRRIQLGDIKYNGSGGDRILPSVRTQLVNSPARKMERLFNCMPKHLREIKGVKVDTFKKHLDEWLMREVPDQPKCDGYAARVAAANNSICHQYTYNKINKRMNGQS